MNKPQTTKSPPREPLTGPDDFRHGSDNCYNYWKCRCEKCRAAHARVARNARGATPPARCPVCGSVASRPPIVKVDGGISHAWYIDAAEHLWEVSWAIMDQADQ